MGFVDALLPTCQECNSKVFRWRLDRRGHCSLCAERFQTLFQQLAREHDKMLRKSPLDIAPTGASLKRFQSFHKERLALAYKFAELSTKGYYDPEHDALQSACECFWAYDVAMTVELSRLTGKVVEKYELPDFRKLKLKQMKTAGHRALERWFAPEMNTLNPDTIAGRRARALEVMQIEDCEQFYQELARLTEETEYLQNDYSPEEVRRCL